jgi:uncharacterized protein YukE
MMVRATKLTGKKKPSMRQTLAASAESVELLNGIWERISRKAFELWQERGYRDGHDFEDWLDAEVIVMEEIHEARE